MGGKSLSARIRQRRVSTDNNPALPEKLRDNYVLASTGGFFGQNNGVLFRKDVCSSPSFQELEHFFRIPEGCDAVLYIPEIPANETGNITAYVVRPDKTITLKRSLERTLERYSKMTSSRAIVLNGTTDAFTRPNVGSFYTLLGNIGILPRDMRPTIRGKEDIYLHLPNITE